MKNNKKVEISHKFKKHIQNFIKSDRSHIFDWKVQKISKNFYNALQVCQILIQFIHLLILIPQAF